jgi:SAM-dependent methyltransferase
MSLRTNLKLVESVAFERREGAFWSDDASYSHSLHGALALPALTSPELVAYFLGLYSQRGDIVLDPFCGSGTTPLEANVQGRIAAYSDVHPMAMKLARAKVDAADITEVTLRLQLCNVRRPINLAHFHDHFKPFFDIDTFRELVNLKIALKDAQADRVTNFIEFLSLALLHGSSAGFFSVYSSPQVSLSPEEQNTLNIKRSQVPDYRAVLPRILRKAATVLRDGVSSGMRAAQSKNYVACADARDLSYLASASVALTITTPPLPMMADPFERMWLRHWFAGLSYRPSCGFEVDSVESWKEFMNASLLEMARVTKPGGRAVINLHALQLPKETIYLDEVITDDVRATLGRYWDVESLILNTPKASLVKNRDREVRKEALTNRVVVLRRR